MLNPLYKRILEISYKKKLSHIGSCLTAVDILDEIYSKRKSDEPVILSAGHAGLALYVILEKYLKLDAEKLFEKHGVHPNRDLENGIYCSSGSLGQGITIACGMALADKNRNVWCYITDGETEEGAVYESLKFAWKELPNLNIYLNANGYGAYCNIQLVDLLRRLNGIHPGIILKLNMIEHLNIPFLKGQDAHYYTMNDLDYKWVMEN